MKLAKGVTRPQSQYFILGLAASSFLMMTGCSNPFELEENKVSFDGYYFSSKLSRSKLDDRSFDLTVRRANRSLSGACLLYTSPSPRDLSTSRMPSSA